MCKYMHGILFSFILFVLKCLIVVNNQTLFIFMSQIKNRGFDVLSLSSVCFTVVCPVPL